MFLTIGLLLFVVQRLGESRDPPTGPTGLAAIGAQKIKVSGADSTQYKIYERDGADVTAKFSSGFTPGEYRLVAMKAGFETFETRFTIESGKTPPDEIVVHWVSIPTEVKIMLAYRSGEVQIDGVPQQPDASLEVRSQWKNGVHTFVWRRGTNDVLEVRFDVKDAEVTMQPLVLKGLNLTGLVVICSNNQLTYQAINANPGVIKKIDDMETTLPATGSFPFITGSSVSFKMRSGGFPLGQYTTTLNGASGVFIKIIPLALRPNVRINERGETAPAVQPAPPAIQQEPPAKALPPQAPVELDDREKLKRRRDPPKL